MKDKNKPDLPVLFEIERKRIKEMQDWRKAGEVFGYYSVRMVVVDHSETKLIHGAIIPVMVPVPCLTARYLDNNGIFQTIKFSYDEFLTIRKNNPTNLSAKI